MIDSSKIKIFFKINGIYLLIFLAISGLYFLLRLPSLTLQPIFVDEAIYIRWSQVMRADSTLRFLPLTDGKTPLFMWLMMPFFKFISDPLLAGRLLSVFSGYLTVLGIFLIAWQFINKRVALLSGFIMAVTPFIVFFDRMALVDSMLAAFTVWSLYLAILLIKTERLDVAMFLGYTLGGGMLVKTPGFFNILVLPFSYILVYSRKNGTYKLLKIVGLWAVALIITMLIYNILRLGPGFSGVSSRNQDYIHSPLRLLQYPLDPFIPHLKDAFEWFQKLLTWPVFLLIVAGIVKGFWSKNRLIIFILCWALVPMIIEMMLLQSFTARYILFSIPPLILIGGWCLDQLLAKYKTNKKIILSLAVVLISLFTFYNDYLFLTAPEKADLPKNERRGYLEDWTAGTGLKEIAMFLDEESKKGKVVVGTEGYFGTMPDGLQIYLDKNRNVVVIGGRNEVSEQIRNSTKYQKTFYVANYSRFPFKYSYLKLIKEYPKAVGSVNPPDKMLLFEVLPEAQQSTQSAIPL